MKPSKPDPKDVIMRMRLPLEESAGGVHTYWNHNGEHQGDYDRLYALLVPDKGESDTEHGEFLRHASNVYYDVYNNGGGNFDCGRRTDLVYFLETLEEHAFPKIEDLKKLFAPFLQPDWQDEDADEVPDNFGRRHIPLLEEAIDFTIAKVKEINEGLQQRVVSPAPAVRPKARKTARHRK